MIYFSIYRFKLIPQGHLVFPRGNAGTALRGAFGHSLKKIVCIDKNAECLTCPVAETCVFQIVFYPIQGEHSSGPKRQRTPPRGFVIKPPLNSMAEYPPGEPFLFDFLLVGRLANYLPYIIVPFRELGEIGIGARRGKFVLDEIASVKPIIDEECRDRSLDPSRPSGKQERVETIYLARDGIVRNVNGRVMLSDLMSAHGNLAPISSNPHSLRGDTGGITRLTLNFLTPTQLRYNPTGEKGKSQIVREPEFHHIVKRLRDRIDALARYYCDGPLNINYKAFGERAEEVKTVSRELYWVDQSRRSHQGHPHDLSGFVGRITFEGNLSEFLPFLVLGQYLHVGENAVFGSGRYGVEFNLRGETLNAG
jgi:hypothetical protein